MTQPLIVTISAIAIIIGGSWILSDLLDPPLSYISGFVWGVLCGVVGTLDAPAGLPMTEPTRPVLVHDMGVNHWDDYGGVERLRPCVRDPEFCKRCGRQMVESIEPGMFRITKTGGPTYERYHSCPTWLTGWRTSRWARGWALPGRGHDSHDADNPLSARGYR